MIRHTVKITIVDDSNAERCNAHCGVDWSLPEVIALASQRIRERFGSRMQLDYVDLAKATTSHYTLRLKQQFQNKNLPLPLLVINGQPKISGQFDIRLLLDAIDAEMEIKR